MAAPSAAPLKVSSAGSGDPPLPLPSSAPRPRPKLPRVPRSARTTRCRISELSFTVFRPLPTATRDARWRSSASPPAPPHAPSTTSTCDLGNRAATFPDILPYARECNAPFLAPACAMRDARRRRDRRGPRALPPPLGGAHRRAPAEQHQPSEDAGATEAGGAVGRGGGKDPTRAS